MVFLLLHRQMMTMNPLDIEIRSCKVYVQGSVQRYGHVILSKQRSPRTCAISARYNYRSVSVISSLLLI